MLKWKKKLWWREEDGRLFIHPIPALASIALCAWLVWKALEYVN